METLEYMGGGDTGLMQWEQVVEIQEIVATGVEWRESGQSVAVDNMEMFDKLLDFFLNGLKAGMNEYLHKTICRALLGSFLMKCKGYISKQDMRELFETAELAGLAKPLTNSVTANMEGATIQDDFSSIRALLTLKNIGKTHNTVWNLNARILNRSSVVKYYLFL